MADISLNWAADLELTPGGDLALSEGPLMTTQHIERRLLTRIRSYIWDQSYGASLPERIGRVAQASGIAAIVRSQMKLEQTVAPTPVPIITVTNPDTDPGLFVILIQYTDAVTGAPISLSFELPSTSS